MEATMRAIERVKVEAELGGGGEPEGATGVGAATGVGGGDTGAAGFPSAVTCIVPTMDEWM